MLTDTERDHLDDVIQEQCDVRAGTAKVKTRLVREVPWLIDLALRLHGKSQASSAKVTAMARWIATRRKRSSIGPQRCEGSQPPKRRGCSHHDEKYMTSVLDYPVLRRAWERLREMRRFDHMFLDAHKKIVFLDSPECCERPELRLICRDCGDIGPPIGDWLLKS